MKKEAERQAQDTKGAVGENGVSSGLELSVLPTDGTPHWADNPLLSWERHICCRAALDDPPYLTLVCGKGCHYANPQSLESILVHGFGTGQCWLSDLKFIPHKDKFPGDKR